MTRALGVMGRILIGLGVLVLAFTGFQIFGTSVIQHRYQAALRDEIQPHLTIATVPHLPLGSAPKVAPITSRPLIGSPISRLTIPAIDLDQIVVEGTDASHLEMGPGHYRGTPLPGQIGNVGIAGHRTTWGRPFFRLDALNEGDRIIVTTQQGSFVYSVTRLFVVRPDQVSVLHTSNQALLTLTTCTPKYSASQRLIVRAALVASTLSTTKGSIPSSPSAPSVPSRQSPTAPPAFALRAQHAATPSLFGALLWSALCGLMAIATILLARRLSRRWVAFLIGVPLFLVLLILAFSRISSLLPANL
ncbi:MAG: class E sortase [Actinomycetes bacterium]